MQETKYFKFHFKNDRTNKAKDYNVKLADFSSAMSFAYDRLDELNVNQTGFRIIGIYEILTPSADYYVDEFTN
jgi:hypothetical protein